MTRRGLSQYLTGKYSVNASALNQTQMDEVANPDGIYTSKVVMMQFAANLERNVREDVRSGKIDAGRSIDSKYGGLN